MENLKFVFYKDDDMYIGYLEEFPDYWSQGVSLDELKENLNDLRKDVPFIKAISTR